MVFRNVRLEKTEQEIQFEQICFPTHEGCSPESMRERMNAAQERSDFC